MTKAKKYSPEVRERARRLVFEHREGYACSGERSPRFAYAGNPTPEVARWILMGEG